MFGRGIPQYCGNSYKLKLIHCIPQHKLRNRHEIMNTKRVFPGTELLTNIPASNQASSELHLHLSELGALRGML